MTPAKTNPAFLQAPGLLVGAFEVTADRDLTNLQELLERPRPPDDKSLAQIVSWAGNPKYPLKNVGNRSGWAFAGGPAGRAKDGSAIRYQPKILEYEAGANAVALVSLVRILHPDGPPRTVAVAFFGTGTSDAEAFARIAGCLTRFRVIRVEPPALTPRPNRGRVETTPSR